MYLLYLVQGSVSEIFSKSKILGKYCRMSPCALLSWSLARRAREVIRSYWTESTAFPCEKSTESVSKCQNFFRSSMEGVFHEYRFVLVSVLFLVSFFRCLFVFSFSVFVGAGRVVLFVPQYLYRGIGRWWVHLDIPHQLAAGLPRVPVVPLRYAVA